MEDLLAKTGTLESQDNKPLPSESLKHIFENLEDTFKSDQAPNSIGKSWANIQDTWKKFCQKPRKEAAANFRLQTENDCKAHHLNKIRILPFSIYQTCNSGIMKAEHLLICPEPIKSLKTVGR
ncbi:uncharacterized protein LOC103523915 [Trichonephila clavipes]|nr:uncharacterized protein LOC103523915 [Trichonephila clavipes]